MMNFCWCSRTLDNLAGVVGAYSSTPNTPTRRLILLCDLSVEQPDECVWGLVLNSSTTKHPRRKFYLWPQYFSRQI
jgi:hypothetical protein